MEQRNMLQFLYPKERGYKLLNLEILPILAIIALRFKNNDLKDRKVLEAFDSDREINCLDYYNFKHGLPTDKLFATKSLLTLLGYTKGVRGKSLKAYKEEFKQFVLSESDKLKLDLTKPFYKTNVYSLGSLSFALSLGAFFLKHAYSDLIRYRETFQDLLNKIHRKYDPVYVMRLAMNGFRAEFWPNDSSFAGERELLKNYCQDYLELILGRTGMGKERIDDMAAMIVAGARIELRKDPPKKVIAISNAQISLFY